MHSRAVASVTVAALAATFATAWHHRAWLIVVALGATTITLVARDRLTDRTLARRAAASGWGYSPTVYTEEEPGTVVGLVTHSYSTDPEFHRRAVRSGARDLGLVRQDPQRTEDRSGR